MTTTTSNLSQRKLGGLYVQTEEQRLVFPLKHTEVEAKIAGNLSRVEVRQTFDNPFAQPLEAIYVFPLPDEAAVDEMEIRLGDRFIKGNIKKREEAQKIYEQARQEGQAAGLLEQERDNIFTQSLANIQPGETIEVSFRYTDSLKFEGGDYEFVFPMVVGPRFIPGTPIDETADTDRVPDASRIMPPIIPPETRSGHDIGITVEIEAGLPVSDVHSPSHQFRVEHDQQIVRVELIGTDTIPNKDLILRYRVGREQTQATILTQADQRGGHFAIYLIPALEYSPAAIVPKDLVFLVDTSGSQQGDPLRKSQELMRRFIKGLNPNDTFTIIDFADTTSQLSAKPLQNTQKNCTEAINYINQLQANGCTYLRRGIQAVLNFPAAEEGRLRSIVLLTDGYIGNEHEVLVQVQQQLKPGNRLYSFGIGSSPNRFLLNRLAEIGRGTAQIVRQDEPTEEVAEKFFRKINNPVLTNIQVEVSTAPLEEGTEIKTVGSNPEVVIYPSAPPDLFAQQPLVLLGRISPLPLPPETEKYPKGEQKKKWGNDESADAETRGRGDAENENPTSYFVHPYPNYSLRLTGMVAGGNLYEQRFNLKFDEGGNPAIAQLWGRARIKDLMQGMFGVETKSGVDTVTQTALTYQLLSPYTAFVAVGNQVKASAKPSGEIEQSLAESSSVETAQREDNLPVLTNISYISMQVPVEMPEGVSRQGIFGSTAYATPFPTIRSKLRSSTTHAPNYSTSSRKRLANYSNLTSMVVGGETLAIPSTGTCELLSPFFGGKAKPQIKSGIKASNPRVKVISAIGLNQTAVTALKQHLQQLQLSLSPISSCKIVFEFRVRKGRVGRIVLDDQASTLEETAVIDLIKRSLSSWRVPQSVSSTVRLTLCIYVS
ncbi:MAG: after-VIT domain-containing protein [Symploca sp. SIO3E6]|nr:after-VIT domain-containing protein [Caldora sp. SIO3E6]